MELKRQSSGVAAVVLAAGMSRRMKSPGAEPKQVLRWAGKPLVQHTLDNIQRSRVDEIVLVLGFAADAVLQQIATDGVRVIMNSDYAQGMGTSLRTGLSVLSSSAKAAFVLLADQPFVRPETLDQMITSHRESAAEITIPLFKGFRGNPVLLDRAVFPELMGLSGDVGCRAIFGSHTQGIHKIDVADPGILLDVDSLEDFEKMTQPGLAAELASLPNLESKEGLPAGRAELVIVGRDAVARALAKLARILQFTVTLVDPFLLLHDVSEADRVLRVLDFERLPAAERYVVVASRGQCDEEAVEQGLRGKAAYVALLANKKRAQEVMDNLRGQGISEHMLNSVCSPAGLEIGAESPEEIALSVLAEIVAKRSKRVRRG
jgi:molybdenum cofactor cytidylyltransferase